MSITVSTTMGGLSGQCTMPSRIATEISIHVIPNRSLRDDSWPSSNTRRATTVPSRRRRTTTARVGDSEPKLDADSKRAEVHRVGVRTAEAAMKRSFAGQRDLRMHDQIET